MPDTLELPRVCGAVIPHVRAGHAVIDELVARGFGHLLRRGGGFARRDPGVLPGLAAVTRSLDDLPEPATRLRRVNPVRINGRPLQMIDLPAREMGAADIPPFSLGVRRQDECALASA